MYSFLRFDLDSPGSPWVACCFSLPGVADELSPQLESARRKGAAVLVKLGCPGLPGGELAQLTEAVYSVVRHLPTDMTAVSFEMHMALAHCRLDAGTRASREQRIASIMWPYFAGNPIDSVQQRVQQLQALAVLVPDAAMDAVLRSQVILTTRSILTVPYGKAVFADSIKLFDKICTAFGWTKKPEFEEALQSCHFSQPPTDRRACLDLIQQASQHGLDKLLPMLLDGLASCEQDIYAADQGDAVFSALQGWVAIAAHNPDANAMNDVVAVEVARFLARRSARCTEIVAATQAAIERGVAFDPVSQAKNTAAMNACAQVQALTELNMTGQRLRKVLAQDRRPVVPSTEVPLADLDPVHARSVEWLVRWIDGPAATNNAPQRLNRQLIAAAASKRRQFARQAVNAPANDKHTDDDLTESDVSLVVQSALGDIADFLLGDIQDMVVRARRLNIPPEALAACAVLMEPLQALRQHTASDELQARDLLRRADSAIEALRRNIRTTEVGERMRQRFMRGLNEALAAEPLVYGKRHGGVIACPTRQADWPWVHGMFHQRWLNVQRLEVDGHTVPLQADQALALHVTGRSLSQYAFDVSVHLWCRKPGSTGRPSLGDGIYPTMNTRDWHDTRLPCAVLHVPPAD